MISCPLASGWLEEAARLQGSGTPFVLATVVARERPQSARSGSKAIVREDGSLAGWVGGGCVRPTVLRESVAALRDGRPRLIRINPEVVEDAREDVRVYAMTCEGEGALDIYLEPVLPRLELMVFGRTLVAEALARLAEPLEMRVCIADPHADRDRFEGAEVVGDLAQASARFGPRTYVVVATMGEGDHEALAAALARPAAYVGLVASPKKAAALFDFLRGSGVPHDRIAAVKAPAGLDFGAVTPAEIALSIIAEIVQHQRAAGSASPQASARIGEELPPPAETESPPSPLPMESTAIDPVCGMAVEVASARHSLEHEGRTLYFCCPHCRAAYQKDPSRYPEAVATR